MKHLAIYLISLLLLFPPSLAAVEQYKIYNDTAFAYLDTDPQKTLQLATKALQLATLANDSRQIAYSNILIGSVHLGNGNYSNAIVAFNNALPLAQKINNMPFLHNIYNNLGIIYKYTGQLDFAMKYYKLALDIATQLDDERSIITTLTNIGNIYVTNDDLDHAVEYYNYAMQKCRETGVFTDDIPLLYNNLGCVYQSQGRYALAKQVFGKAYHYYDSLNYLSGKLVLLNNLANVSTDLCDYVEAERIIARAEALHAGHSYDENRKELYNTAYNMYLAWGHYKRAIEYQDRYYNLKDSIYSKELLSQLAELKAKFQVDSLHNAAAYKDVIIEKQKSENRLFVVIIAITSLLSILLVVGIYQKTHYNRSLRSANVRLQEKETEIQDNLQYSRHIQLSCMSNFAANVTDDYFVLDMPKMTVGGDFYLIRRVRGRQYFVVGDSTGHGISGGFLSVFGIDAVNFALNNFVSLADMLDCVNDKFYNYVSKNPQLRHESMCVSLAYVDDDRLVFAGSKHKLWHYCRRTDVLTEHATNVQVVGMNKQVDFVVHELPISAGDKVFLASDGYPDQFGGPENHKLKYANFRRLLQQCGSMSNHEAQKFLQSYLAAWKGDNEQTDDILVLGFTKTL